MDARLRALNRFGLGARIGERRGLSDPRAWLREQLEAPTAALLDEQRSALSSLAELGAAFRAVQEAARNNDTEGAAAGRRALREGADREATAAQAVRLTTPSPFVERLVAFWSNHLCVSTMKAQVVATAGHYERTVIRPHVLGRFEDMVMASARHPAMLAYLDNAQSIGPRSRAARGAARRGRDRGLNENYARELLELHTVGVEGGYDQSDVQQLARIFTGWSIAGLGPRDRNAYGFRFRPELHEPGDKSVLGHRYAEAGEEEGRLAIRHLCRRQETADFVCTKLVRHFVADDPPLRAVDRLARVFRETEGDLAAVSAALVDLDEAWDDAHLKIRHPQDWLTAALRALDVTDPGPRIVPILRQLRHVPWTPPSPKGYGDTMADWADPDALMNRAELARSLSRRFASGRRSAAADLLDVLDVGANDPLAVMMSDQEIPAAERVALVAGGPAFQWR